MLLPETTLTASRFRLNQPERRAAAWNACQERSWEREEAPGTGFAANPVNGRVVPLARPTGIEPVFPP